MDVQDALLSVPTTLRNELLTTFGEITQHFRSGRWEPSELNGGKLCEVVYSIIKGCADGTYPAHASKPSNMVKACQDLEKATSLPRGLRIQIPRMLVALYEIRNNRNVGHVGGDVDPNHMDAVCVVQMCKWIIAELIRNFHNLTVDEASEVVEMLIQRESPVVWKVNDMRRVLATHLSSTNQTLVLLYNSSGAVSIDDLLKWTEYANTSRYRSKIIESLHKGRYVEYDHRNGTVTLSPKGAEFVEGLWDHINQFGEYGGY